MKKLLLLLFLLCPFPFGIQLKAQQADSLEKVILPYKSKGLYGAINLKGKILCEAKYTDYTIGQYASCLVLSDKKNEKTTQLVVSPLGNFQFEPEAKITPLQHGHFLYQKGDLSQIYKPDGKLLLETTSGRLILDPDLKYILIQEWENWIPLTKRYIGFKTNGQVLFDMVASGVSLIAISENGIRKNLNYFQITKPGYDQVILNLEGKVVLDSVKLEPFYNGVAILADYNQHHSYLVDTQLQKLGQESFQQISWLATLNDTNYYDVKWKSERWLMNQYFEKLWPIKTNSKFYFNPRANLLVTVDKKQLMFNLAGDSVIPPNCEYVKNWSVKDSAYFDFRIVKNRNSQLYGVVDPQGRYYLKTGYKHISQTEENYFIFSDEDSFGLMRCDFKDTILSDADLIGLPSEGIYAIGRKYPLDSIPPSFCTKKIYSTSEAPYSIRYQYRKINEAGTESAYFNECLPFQNGRGMIWKGCQTYEIDSNFNVLEKDSFKIVTHFYSGLAIIQDKIGKYGLIDSLQNVVIHPFSDLIPALDSKTRRPGIYYSNKGQDRMEGDHRRAPAIVDSIIPYQLNGLWGFLKTNGDILLQPQFISYKYVQSGHHFKVWNKSSRVGIVNSEGQLILEPNYDYIHYMTELKLYQLVQGDEMTYANALGEILLIQP